MLESSFPAGYSWEINTSTNETQLSGFTRYCSHGRNSPQEGDWSTKVEVIMVVSI